MIRKTLEQHRSNIFSTNLYICLRKTTILQRRCRSDKSSFKNGDTETISNDHPHKTQNNPIRKSSVTAKVDTLFNKLDEAKDCKKQRKARKKRKGSKLKYIEGKEYKSSDNINNQEIVQAIAPNKTDIPQLAHNLDRVLFSPGVHFLQDPRTRVYNFSPFLKKVIHHDDFNFGAISSFIPASKDNELLNNAKKFNRQFYSSTSSMTGILTKFYLFLNNYNTLNVGRFGAIPFNGLSYTAPNSLIVEPKGKVNNETIYSIQADKSCDTETILSKMGHCMEILLTNPKDEFIKYSKDYSEGDLKVLPNTYNYSSYGGFLMRSQLDCYDPRLPGNGTFDLKTRATLNIRYNSTSPDINNNNYQIYKMKGQYESYEAEFKDLIRTGALLKYLFQARIGQMDGIYVAYHNVNSLFGFEYLPLSEIDKIFYNDEKNSLYEGKILRGNDYEFIKQVEKAPSFIAETQFKWSLEMWENLLRNHILNDLRKSAYEGSSFRLVTHTYKGYKNKEVDLRVWVLPISRDEASELQGFPDQFPASFNQRHLSMEMKRSNIMNHEKKLNEFNDKTTKDRPLLSYSITKLNASLDGKKIKPGILPLKQGDWQMQYKISKIDNVKVEDYKQLFAKSIQSLYRQVEQDDNAKKYKNKRRDGKVEKIKEDIKSLESLGSSRLNDWRKMDDEIKVYVPSEIV